MKILYKLCIFITLFFISENIYSEFSKPLHDFHLSICKINYNKETKSLELSFRFFTDDIEKAILNYNRKKIISKDGKKTKESEKYLSSYILSKFSVKVENNKINYDFIGWEIKETVIWCYIEIKNINLADEILVENKLMLKILPNQKNITTLINGNSKRSIIFNKKNIKASISAK